MVWQTTKTQSTGVSHGFWFFAFYNSSLNWALSSFCICAFFLLRVDLMTSQMLLNIFPFAI